MKYVLSICCLLFANALFSQNNSPPSQFLKIQGGFLYDSHSRVNYSGPNILKLGWTRFKNDVVNEINLELISYTTDFQEQEETSTSSQSWQRRRISAEIEYFRSVFHQGSINNGLYLGPTASFLYLNDNFAPSNSSDTQYDEECYCLGLGIKAVYSYQLTERIFLNASTKVTILDVGLETYQGFDPVLPLSRQYNSTLDIDLLRDQFQLLIGVGFRL